MMSGDVEKLGKYRLGPASLISKLVIEFSDGTTEVWESDDYHRVLYKQSLNDNRAKKSSDQISWTHHNISWQSGHRPTKDA